MISRGFSALSVSGLTSHFSSVPGLKFSTTTSVSRRRSISSRLAFALWRSNATLRLFRPITSHHTELRFSCFRPHTRITSPTPGGSTLTTSAPRSARSCPQNGPAMNDPSSITRMPAKGPAFSEFMHDLPKAQVFSYPRLPRHFDRNAHLAALHKSAAVDFPPTLFDSKSLSAFSAFLRTLSLGARNLLSRNAWAAAEAVAGINSADTDATSPNWMPRQPQADTPLLYDSPMRQSR